ncbi:FAD-binding oxidoreductase [Microbacterium sp. CSI-V]|uniref:FAD-binding oxidoreductase n=1 Tax=unclassified Microbacterium TaxID=2609290 RepID=UPI00097C219D|nr:MULTISPECIES: FAD-linked oxidase C-terminal domain-containing protein [unclassified Microbacterium]MXS74459.1 FAD-binding protein [Microbacterium sp. TL13]ONI63057.1 FAD-binding oxidoreductase [Microbacterium sp. CSI-V]
MTAPATEIDRAIDRSGLRPVGAPTEVVVARDVAEVQETVRRAAAAGTPLITRGAGSGLAGGAVAGEGAIVLDLSRLTRIRSIDPVDGTAEVEAGVITADLDAAARTHGLMYAPDPGSVGISTVGGNIATNAGGLRGAKYGVTRDAVLSVDVVLADGSLVRLGRPTIKGVTGYDLAGLVVGSEGTLGIVVAARVRLLPAPQRVATASAFFATLEDAARAVAAIAVSGARPAVLEILDGATLGAIDAASGTALRAQGEALLLAQTDGFGAAEEMAVVLAAVAPTATRHEWTEDAERAADLLSARRQALPALERIGRPLIEDIAVPRSRLAEAISGIRLIADRHGVPIFVFGHAGDGNLHPIIVVEPGEGDLPETAVRAADDIFALALSLGGTVTAEHGVGRLKREWARRELGEDAVRLHNEIKRVFDPLGILNPGSGY